MLLRPCGLWPSTHSAVRQVYATQHPLVQSATKDIIQHFPFHDPCTLVAGLPSSSRYSCSASAPWMWQQETKAVCVYLHIQDIPVPWKAHGIAKLTSSLQLSSNLLHWRPLPTPAALPRPPPRTSPPVPRNDSLPLRNTRCRCRAAAHYTLPLPYYRTSTHLHEGGPQLEVLGLVEELQQGRQPRLLVREQVEQPAAGVQLGQQLSLRTLVQPTQRTFMLDSFLYCKTVAARHARCILVWAAAPGEKTPR